MLAAVNLNNQFHIETYKIDYVSTNDSLSAKLNAKIFTSKRIPKMFFGVSGIIS